MTSSKFRTIPNNKNSKLPYLIPLPCGERGRVRGLIGYLNLEFLPAGRQAFGIWNFGLSVVLNDVIRNWGMYRHG